MRVKRVPRVKPGVVIRVNEEAYQQRLATLINRTEDPVKLEKYSQSEHLDTWWFRPQFLFAKAKMEFEVNKDFESALNYCDAGITVMTQGDIQYIHVFLKLKIHILETIIADKPDNYYLNHLLETYLFATKVLNPYCLNSVIDLMIEFKNFTKDYLNNADKVKHFENVLVEIITLNPVGDTFDMVKYLLVHLELLVRFYPNNQHLSELTRSYNKNAMNENLKNQQDTSAYSNHHETYLQLVDQFYSIDPEVVENYSECLRGLIAILPALEHGSREDKLLKEDYVNTLSIIITCLISKESEEKLESKKKQNQSLIEKYMRKLTEQTTNSGMHTTLSIQTIAEYLYYKGKYIKLVSYVNSTIKKGEDINRHNLELMYYALKELIEQSRVRDSQYHYQEYLAKMVHTLHLLSQVNDSEYEEYKVSFLLFLLNYESLPATQYIFEVCARNGHLQQCITEVESQDLEIPKEALTYLLNRIQRFIVELRSTSNHATPDTASTEKDLQTIRLQQLKEYIMSLEEQEIVDEEKLEMAIVNYFNTFKNLVSVDPSLARIFLREVYAYKDIPSVKDWIQIIASSEALIKLCEQAYSYYFLNPQTPSPLLEISRLFDLTGTHSSQMLSRLIIEDIPEPDC